MGSPGVGAMVAKTASANLTPVCLELGGKDPFVVCDDANIDSIVQTACRGVWQNMGQNCAGPERFFVYDKVTVRTPVVNSQYFSFYFQTLRYSQNSATRSRQW